MEGKNKRKLVFIIIIVIVGLLLVIPSAALVIVHNSNYSCQFDYNKVDDITKEIVRKHTYYNAADKVVEVELNQDVVNSLIKDNFDKLGFNLPKNFTIREMLFNTEDQRLYINGKYGSLNVPISFKITVNSTKEAVTVAATDMRLGSMAAPGFLKRQISADSMKYAFNFKDNGVPEVFYIKDVHFGPGYVKVSVQLEADKVADYAAAHRTDLVGEIDKIKNSQQGVVNNFLGKLLSTDVLSEDKIKTYAKSVLDNGEVVNSALFFATTENPDTYTKAFSDVQQTVTKWAEPLQAVRYYGSIDATVETLLADQKLKDLLTWVVPADQLNGYENTVNEYYGMYKDYYALYENVLASIDKFAAGFDTKGLNNNVKWILDYTAQAEDARHYALDQLGLIDAEGLDDVVAYLERDTGTAGRYIDSMDKNQYQIVKDSLLGLDSTKAYSEDLLKNADMKAVKDFQNVLESRRRFLINVISLLRQKDYQGAIDKVTSDGVIDSKTKAFYNKYSKEIDLSQLGLSN